MIYIKTSVKYLALLILLFVKICFCKAQVNLVQNPGFENNSACPFTLAEVDKAISWDSCRSTPDYFNLCGINSEAQVPFNAVGYQQPAQGNAYCGFITYDPNTFYREIIVGQLSLPLIISQKYYITFKVNRADSNFVVGYSTNKIGVKFSKVKQKHTLINNVAHFYSNNVIIDKTNWTKLSGSFIADSAYNYIMIGNFFDDANTTVINDGTGTFGYYYIDEVCVSTDSLFASTYVTDVRESNEESHFKIYPNPANNTIQLRCGQNQDFKIYNSYGTEINFVLETKYNEPYINCSSWQAGLYYMKIKNAYKKLIVKH